MLKEVHIYDITVSTGEVFEDVHMEGSISSNYSGIINDFIPIKTKAGQTVELTKYQIVKAELVRIEK